MYVLEPVAINQQEMTASYQNSFTVEYQAAPMILPKSHS